VFAVLYLQPKLLQLTLQPVRRLITGSAVVCVGSTTLLSDITTGGTWASLSPLTASVGASSGLVTGIAGGTAIIIYTITNSFGCSVSTSKSIAVNPVSSVPNTVSISASQPEIYAGQPDTFYAVAPYSGSNPAYNWYINSVLIPGATKYVCL
jgi:hypothetical protein